MKKSWIIILVTAVIIIGIILGINIYKKNQVDNNIVENEIEEISERVTDECIEEYKFIEESNLEIETNSNEEKISPNCLITLRRYYDECQHTINEYIDVPKNLVNGTQEDLERDYENWTIEKFSSNQIIMYKEFQSNCGQHFILKDDNGKITVYKINEYNEEEIYEKTDIAIDYLTETDKIEIENGIRVNGIEELNQLIEDYE